MAQWIRRNVEESGRGLCLRYYSTIYTKVLGEATNYLWHCIRNEIRIRNLCKMNL